MTFTAPSPGRNTLLLPLVLGLGLGLIAAQTLAGPGAALADLRHCGDAGLIANAAEVAQTAKVKVAQVSATEAGAVSRSRVEIPAGDGALRPVAYARCLPPA